MLYRVSEIAELMGLSKVSVYNRINHNKDRLKPYISKDKGVTYINDKGFTVLKELFTDFTEEPDQEIEIPQEPKVSEVETITREIIEMLKGELEMKNLQLQEKDKQIAELLKVTQAQQVLMKTDREQEEPKMIEAPKKNFIQKLLGM